MTLITFLEGGRIYFKTYKSGEAFILGVFIRGRVFVFKEI